MGTPESPATRPRRLSAQPFALATAETLGEGVLLARHGDRILRLHWTTSTRDGDPEAIRELRFLGRLSAIWIVASVALCLLMAWGMATFMDPAAAEELVSAYLGPVPAGGPDAAADAATAGP